ncbi:NAC domain-containing protein 8 [Acorus gramineus]|uniref:NAC domain-containing protein 8 n=1 Tax=Acorus gramineus TaxID=55184 RepID=A0AAV9AK01_ACOGR|nr:NAC domain-containing protein 8 [Acorus gramineus]
MAGPAWVIDGNRIATKIKNASDSTHLRRIVWKSNPTRTCPSCNKIIDNTDVIEWPGLPKGVKFDPSDQELILHLRAKVGEGDAKPDAFIEEFIYTLEEDDGICHTHPKNLRGVKGDGSVSHFFHRTVKAYSTGDRKRRKILGDDIGRVRWHKTGKTKPVIVNGVHLGSKKIMVLYMSIEKSGKPVKTNWVMHQFHLGTKENEEEGQFVVSKLFCQQQPNQGEKNDQGILLEIDEGIIPEVDSLLSPEALSPEHQADMGDASFEWGQDPSAECKEPSPEVMINHEIEREENVVQPECEKLDNPDNHCMEESKWWEGESQYLLDSQQLVEGLSLCDELLQSQPMHGVEEMGKSVPRLSDYARMGAEVLKKDLEECQNLNHIDHLPLLDTPPDFHLSQLEFGSQDSFLAWGGTKVADATD